MSQPAQRERKRERNKDRRRKRRREEWRRERTVSSQTPLAECHSRAASKPTRSIICPTFKWNALTKGPSASRPITHTQTHKTQAKQERMEERKESKGRKGMLRKDEERQRQMERGGAARGGIERKIEIPFLCPASYCLAVWLTKAISSKQQVGMKI